MKGMGTWTDLLLINKGYGPGDALLQKQLQDEIRKVFPDFSFVTVTDSISAGHFTFRGYADDLMRKSSFDSDTFSDECEEFTWAQWV